MQWSLADRLGHIDVPTLLVSSDEDYTQVPLKEHIAARMPSSPSTTTPATRFPPKSRRPSTRSLTRSSHGWVSERRSGRAHRCRRVRKFVKWVLLTTLGAAPTCREQVWAWEWRARGCGSAASANAGAKSAYAPTLPCSRSPTLPHPQTPNRSHASTQFSETSSQIGMSVPQLVRRGN